MNRFFEMIKRLDKKYALSFISGIIFGAFGIYATFFYTKKPEIRFEILNNTNLVDLHENVGDLEIKYKSKDILKEKQSIRIYTIRLKNIGSIDITKSFYDARDPLGFDISNGTIINNIEIINASSDYLKSKLQPVLTNNSIVTFTEPLLNSGDYITLKFLVLHANNVTPSLKSKGIISGISNIQVVNVYDESNNESLWKQTWFGNIYVQLLRMIIYPFISMFSIVILFIIIIIPAIYFSELYNEIKRKKIAKKFLSENEHIVNDALTILVNKFKKSGEKDILTISELLNNKLTIEKILNEKDNYEKLKKIEYDIKFMDLDSPRNPERQKQNQELKKLRKEYEQIDLSLFLLNKKLVQLKNHKVIIDNDIIEKLKIFIDFIKE